MNGEMGLQTFVTAIPMKDPGGEHSLIIHSLFLDSPANEWTAEMHLSHCTNTVKKKVCITHFVPHVLTDRAEPADALFVFVFYLLWSRMAFSLLQRAG